MDDLYRYNVNSESDIVTFRNKSRSTLQQALTFYNAERHLSIMVRDFPWGQLGKPVDIHRHIGNDELELLWTDPGESIVAELIWNAGKGDPVPANAGSIAVDANSYPHILNKARGRSLFYHYHHDKQWNSVENAFPSMSEDNFPMPDGMGVISARGDAIYFHRLSPRIDRKGVLLAKGYVTRHFNASVDKTAIAQGWLSMMLTKNKHSGVNSNKGSYPTDAFVMTIPLVMLDGFDTPFLRR